MEEQGAAGLSRRSRIDGCMAENQKHPDDLSLS